LKNKKPNFNDFLWFNKKPLKLVEKEGRGNLGDQHWIENMQELPSRNFN
jgi:hypothetical protein